MSLTLGWTPSQIGQLSLPQLLIYQRGLLAAAEAEAQALNEGRGPSRGQAMSGGKRATHTKRQRLSQAEAAQLGLLGGGTSSGAASADTADKPAVKPVVGRSPDKERLDREAISRGGFSGQRVSMVARRRPAP